MANITSPSASMRVLSYVLKLLGKMQIYPVISGFEFKIIQNVSIKNENCKLCNFQIYNASFRNKSYIKYPVHEMKVAKAWNE